MYCDVCGCINGHLYGCPENQTCEKNDFKKIKYCDSCEEPIQKGELYIIMVS